jgi:hypothetical protein
MALRPAQSFVLALTAIGLSLPAAAQVAPTTDRVEQAAFSRGANGAATIGFGRRALRVGDQIEQLLVLEMRLATSLRQGDHLVEKNELRMRNTQRRQVTTTEVVGGHAQAVLVRYPLATKQHAVGEAAKKPLPDSASGAPEEAVSQPVEGKAYRCRRDPNDDQKLIVTDEAGNIPPLEEFEIVARGMDMVGRPNPLAEFLAGRTVKMGETLTVPKEVADRLFGISDRFGDVTRFDLTLQEARAEAGVSCAVFLASIDAASNDSSQMRLQVEGPLVIEVETCRAVRTRLAGPIGMTESRGTYSTAYQLISTGQLTMSLAAVYRDASR